MKKLAMTKLIASMTIFGTIGLAVVNLEMPRGFIAMVRGLIGALSLIVIMLISGKRLSFSAIRKNLFVLILSGAFIGANWIFLFESYSYTSVSVATLAYYMAPVFVIFISSAVLKEKLTARSVIAAAVALVGMLLVSGILNGGIKDKREFIGIGLALCAALLYATVTVLNKKMKDIPAYETSVVQLGAAFAVILPYTLFAEDLRSISRGAGSVILLLMLGFVHTGLAYALFFSSVKELNGQTVAVFSYVDPCLSVILSIIFLGDEPTPQLIVGAVLIIGALLAHEIKLKPLKGR